MNGYVPKYVILGKKSTAVKCGAVIRWHILMLQGICVFNWWTCVVMICIDTDPTNKE